MPTRNRNLLLTAALAFPVFQVLDLGLTYFLMRFGFVEANPFGHLFLNSVPLALLVKLGFGILVAFVLYVFYILHPSPRDLVEGIPRLVPGIVIFVSMAPVLWNLTWWFYALLAGI